MKFQKAVFVNIADSHFDKKYLDQIDEFAEKRVMLSRDDSNLMTELKDCDCLMLGFQVPTGKDIFDAAPNLKLINILATAYGTVDLEIAKQKNINFGIIGLGNIGNRVAELAAGFGANVSYWSRNKKDNDFTYKELDELLSESDYISVNVAQTPETENLLNDKNIPLIKSGAVVISTVPPEVIETNALASRLAKKDITFVSDHADEMSEETISALKPYSNCLLLPAIAFITAEARINKQEIFIGNIKAALEGKPQNKVN